MGGYTRGQVLTLLNSSKNSAADTCVDQVWSRRPGYLEIKTAGLGNQNGDRLVQ